MGGPVVIKERTACASRDRRGSDSTEIDLAQTLVLAFASCPLASRSSIPSAEVCRNEVRHPHRMDACEPHRSNADSTFAVVGSLPRHSILKAIS